MAPPIRLDSAARGRDLIRLAIAACVAGPGESRGYAAKRWGRLLVEKAGVPNTESDGMDVVASARAEYLAAFSERTSLLRMRGVRFSSPNTPILTPSDRPTAGWIGEGKAIPVGRFNLVRTTLGQKKIGSISVFSLESLADPKSEGWIANDVTAQMHASLDAALFDPTSAGDDATPASIAYGAPSSASTGDPAEDVKALIADFSGDVNNASFITDQNTATRMALYRDSSGIVAFPDVALVGGSILGLPLIVSRHAPNDSSGGNLILVDGASIMANFEDVEISRTTEALIEQDSAPSGDSITPTAATATLVSLFQADCAAIKGVLWADWKVIRRGGVSYVSGTNY